MHDNHADHRPHGLDGRPATADGLGGSGIDDLLAILPYLLGYHPSPSDVVCVGIRASSVQGAAVIPVHEVPLPPDLKPFWRQVRDMVLDEDLGLLHRAGDTSVAHGSEESQPPVMIVVSYGAAEADRMAESLLDHDASQPGPRPRQDLLDRLDVGDVVRVHDGRWRSLLCHDPACCPAQGRPLDPAPASLVAMIARTGRSARASRSEVDDILRPGRADQVGAVAAVLARRTTDSPSTGDWRDALERVRAARGQGFFATAESETGESDPTNLREQVERAADLLAAVEDVRVRDRCLVWRDETAWSLWTGLIRYAPPGWTAPVATLIASLAYGRGDTVLARVAAARALAERHDYSLAATIRDCLLMGLDPDVFEESISAAAAAVSDLDNRTRTDAHSQNGSRSGTEHEQN